MQVMGQSARECGFTAQFLSALCDPATGIEVGCTLFQRKLTSAKGDTNQALEFWNGGSNPNYAAEVQARRPHYPE